MIHSSQSQDSNTEPRRLLALYEDEMLFDNRETRMAFIEAIRLDRPDVIFAPPKFKDYNQDHDICG